MSIESYKKRMLVTGNTPILEVKNSTQKSNYDAIMHSPTRKSVKINDELEDKYCLVTDIDSYEIRQFLFLPNTVVNKGTYIHYEDYVYLVVKGTSNEDFPKVNALVCNFQFPIKKTVIREVVGKLPNGRPDIRDIESVITIPSVMSGKIYSTLDNSSLPLPEGVQSILIPFRDELPEINQNLMVYNSQYRITEVLPQILIRNNEVIGYFEIRLQRESNENG